MENKTPHQPILVNEWLDALSKKKINVYVDATLGAGGHAQAVLNTHPEIEKFIGIDQDPSALDLARGRLTEWVDKVNFFHGNFSQLKDAFLASGSERIDAILFDLGVSSMQLDQPERGFSFRRCGPLDMRMDPTQKLTAAEIVNTWEEAELGEIFRTLGEEKKWRRAARKIVEEREKRSIRTTGELADLLEPLLRGKTTKIHPATKIFQALRICVNKELDVIDSALDQTLELLNPGGIIGVISFHSLEDRIIKRRFRFEASDKIDTKGVGGLFLEKEKRLRVLTRKPLIPRSDELEKNPRSRSAKLRIAQRI